MSAAPANLGMRVYGLEGVTRTQDAAITRQALTLADHDQLLGTHTTELAVQDTKLATHTEQIGALTTLMNKVIWALVGLSTAITVSAVTIAITVGSGG
jgi:hypothetical protein